MAPRLDETQSSISKWHRQTFGRGEVNIDLAFRLFDEMVELLLEMGASPADIHNGLLDALGEVDDDLRYVSRARPVEFQADELADVAILTNVVASHVGVNLRASVNRKMMLNRARRWRVTAPGLGHHIKEGS